MPISSQNFGILMLLDELHIQCSLFERNVARLEDAADHWIKQARGEDFDRKVPPMDILAWATVCLSAMAAIRRLLHSGQSRNQSVAQHRRDVLRAFLGDPSLPNVYNAAVRNSWEHADERIDEFVPTLHVGDSVSQLNVSSHTPEPRSKMLKRFDPQALTIHFLDQAIPLRPARAEVADLSSRLDSAIVRLQAEVVRPWG